MTLLRRFKLWPALALTLLAAFASQLPAQNLKPVAVVSIASVERNLADVVYLTRIVGMEDTGKTAQLFGNALTAGMDKTRPSGLIVIPAGKDFKAVVFVPVTNLKLLLEVHKEQVGEPKDIGGSILEIGTDRKAFVKEQGGWAFISEQKEHLSVIPADPLQLLGDMPSKYNIAGRIYVQNIPAEQRKLAIDQIKQGMDAAAKAQPMQPGQPNNQAQIEAMMKVYTQQIERLLNEADEVTIGLAVNSTGKSVGLDFGLTAKDGTELAKRMGLQMNLKTSFAGMALPEAAFSAVGTAQLTEADLAQAKAMLKSQRDQFMQQIESVAASLSPEQKEAMKKLLGRYLELAEQASSTKQDNGFAVVLAPKSFTAVAGGFVPEGTNVDTMVKELADFVKANPNQTNAIEFTMNSGTLGDLKLHKGSMGLKPEDAVGRMIFGEKLDFLVASGKSSIYFAAGKDMENVLKKVIDRSSAQSSQPAQPFQMTLAVLPIVKFYQSIDEDNPFTAAIIPGLISSLEQEGGDKLLIAGAASPKSMTYRVEVQEGIIRAVGEAAKMFSAQLGGPPQ